MTYHRHLARVPAGPAQQAREISSKNV